MREPRNPFTLRAAEQIESDATFLRLFGPGALDVLPEEGLWERVHIIRSSPGGGKTSLMRLFTPPLLHALHNFRAGDDYKELFQRLKLLGAVSDAGPQVLGVMISCARNFAMIEDLSVEDARRERLLYALVDARIMLAALRGALTLRGLSYPRDLSALEIIPSDEIDLPQHLDLAGSGEHVFRWACELEKSVCRAIDSFEGADDHVVDGHGSLYSPSLLRSAAFLCNGLPVADRVTLMIDDVHQLTSIQRQNLLKTIVDLRSPTGVWLAERTEVLGPNDVLSGGATTGRDYAPPINLEDFWRTSTGRRRFEHLVLSIADRRARSTPGVDAGEFSSYLEDTVDTPKWNQAFEEASATNESRARQAGKSAERYSEWIKEAQAIGGTPRERAVAWRRLEILIERDQGKKQQALFPDLALPNEELERREDSGVRAAAEFLTAHEFGLPYYFGPARLAATASANIEQFLTLAGDTFEEVMAALIIGRNGVLPADRQESILRRSSSARWTEIPHRIPGGRDVWAILEGVKRTCQTDTYKPNAPYAPGVTGIAISMADRARLADPTFRAKSSKYERLARALTACITHNLMEGSTDRVQGQPGQTWMILYLNRILCVNFELPLGYGGWRPKKLDELCEWLLPNVGATANKLW